MSGRAGQRKRRRKAEDEARRLRGKPETMGQAARDLSVRDLRETDQSRHSDRTTDLPYKTPK